MVCLNKRGACKKNKRGLEIRNLCSVPQSIISSCHIRLDGIPYVFENDIPLINTGSDPIISSGERATNRRTTRTTTHSLMHKSHNVYFDPFDGYTYTVYILSIIYHSKTAESLVMVRKTTSSYDYFAFTLVWTIMDATHKKKTFIC